MERKPDLAGTTDPAERDEARLGKQLGDLSNFRVATDEAGEFDGQIVWTSVQAAQRWKRHWKVWIPQLIDVLRPGEVSDTVVTEVDQVESSVRHDLPGCRRDEYLSAVARAEQTSRAVERGREVVTPGRTRQDQRCQGGVCAGGHLLVHDWSGWLGTSGPPGAVTESRRASPTGMSVSPRSGVRVVRR